MRSARARRARLFAVIAILALAAGTPGSEAASGRGRELWLARYDGPAHDSEYVSDVAVGPDGAIVFVTGSSLGATSGLDYRTIAYEAATGSEIWTRHYNGPGDSTDYGGGVVLSPDGATVFVTGTSDGSSSDYATIAYDASTGTRRWVARYDGGDTDSLRAQEVSPDGNLVFVTGQSITREGSGGDTYATVAYDASTGEQVWVRRYDVAGNDYDIATALDVSPDGSAVFVTGISKRWSSRGNDYTTLAYDASTGAKLWLQRYDGPRHVTDEASDLDVSPDGSVVFVTGTSLGWPDWNGTYATVAYDAATGTRLWVRRYDGPANGDDVAIALEASPDGSDLFVTGRSEGATAGSTEYATVAYDAGTGAKLWHRRYTGGHWRDSAIVSALGVSPDGSTVVVTGTSYGPTSYNDYATVAYDASSGKRLWWQRYNGRENDADHAWALAVSPDGSAVYVTGSSIGRRVQSDYATLAYRIA